VDISYRLYPIGRVREALEVGRNGQSAPPRALLPHGLRPRVPIERVQSWSMNPKSGNRFSEKIMRQQNVRAAP
jgi:hypothetical protein